MGRGRRKKGCEQEEWVGTSILRDFTLHFCDSLSFNQCDGEVLFNRILVSRTSHCHI